MAENNSIEDKTGRQEILECNGLVLESGYRLGRYELAYHTYGTLNAERSNVVWIFHALTANSNPVEWWDGLVGEGRLFDPEKYFIVCVNMPGSCYGSTGPLSLNEYTGTPWYHDFPWFTPRDMIRSYRPLREALGIEKIHIGIGGSMGGQQLLEWAIEEPELFEHIIPLATNAFHSAWGIAWNTSQRMAIEADGSWLERHNNAGEAGMMAARATALISYRSYEGYGATQTRNVSQWHISREGESDGGAASYQRYQGQKLANRFNAFSYYALSKGMDAHNVGRGRETVEDALKSIRASALVIGITSDGLFPLNEQKYLATHIPFAKFVAIESMFGHDGFLLEFESIEENIIEFLNYNKMSEELRHEDYHHRKLLIGMFGFGVVGEGLYHVLKQTPSLKAEIKRVCIKHPDKKRNAPKELFTTDKEALLNDEEINVIVEVIDDSVAAFEIVKTALLNGKHVVSASKKMIAENLKALLKLQQDTGLSLLYEASACASIPVIRNLEEYYDNDLLHGIQAIVNGSTNYILTKMFEEKLSYKDALLQAQQLGFAESNPTLDVEGYDAVNKWNNLLVHAYGIVTEPQHILFTGIQNVNEYDSSVSSEKGWVIRLIAQAKKLDNGKVAAFVLPQFIPNSDHLAFVRNEFNGVVIESSFAEKQFFYGKGAGSFPTASAVLSDISALRYDYKYEYKKLYHHKPAELSDDFYLKVYLAAPHAIELPHEKFEWIEEFHAREDYRHISGVIHASKLVESDWWKAEGISLILLPNAIIENLDLNKAKKRSLELAGIQFHHGAFHW